MDVSGLKREGRDWASSAQATRGAQAASHSPKMCGRGLVCVLVSAYYYYSDNTAVGTIVAKGP